MGRGREKIREEERGGRGRRRHARPLLLMTKIISVMGGEANMPLLAVEIFRCKK